MKFEFIRGIPDGCITWLIENVGLGNRANDFLEIRHDDGQGFAWRYDRIRKLAPFESGDDPHWFSGNYIPTITINDERKAVLFALRWS